MTTSTDAPAPRDAAGETENPWRKAIIDAAVVGWTYRREHEHEPLAAVNALLCHAQIMALDPAVSEPARKLYDEIAALRARCEALETALRETLWLTHGCPFSALYGDDGEMQCNAIDCPVGDFKREPVETIRRQLFEHRMAALAAARAGAGGDTTMTTTAPAGREET